MQLGIRKNVKIHTELCSRVIYYQVKQRNLLKKLVAGVAELVDARDLKSLEGNLVPVRFRSSALNKVRSYSIAAIAPFSFTVKFV